MTRAQPDQPSPRIIGVDTCARDWVRAQLVEVLHDAPGAVRAASLELATTDGIDGGPRAKVRVALDGPVVRAVAAGPGTKEAIEHATARLRRQLVTTRERPRCTPIGGRRARAWEYGDTPQHRPAFANRPPRERALVRRKSYDRALRTPEAAVIQATLLDYDFFLFVDGRTRRPAVVRRNGPQWQLAEATACSVENAVELLDLTNARFVFFVDPVNGLHALYRRYDGNYGLLSPESAGA
jgi:hypothetical protein